MNAWKTGIKILFYIILAVGINWICSLLKSSYLTKFLQDKIVELLITLLAINVATKLEEISRLFKVDLSLTVTEVKRSIIYQIWLISFAVILLIFFNSEVLKVRIPELYPAFFNSLFIAIFICAIDILRDTGLAIFVISESLSQNNK
jgi:hypothetical protein